MRWLHLIMATLVGGCAVTGQTDLDAVRPENGRSLLYVYRKSTFVGSANSDVSFLHIDGKPVGRINIGGNRVISVTPGEHKLRTSQSFFGSDTGKSVAEFAVTVSPDATSFVRYEEGLASLSVISVGKTTVGNGTGYFRFEKVEPNIARQEIADTQTLN